MTNLDIIRFLKISPSSGEIHETVPIWRTHQMDTKEANLMKLIGWILETIWPGHAKIPDPSEAPLAKDNGSWKFK